VRLEEALERRRSIREYLPTRLSDREIDRLLWAAQGITDDEGHRTAPSAGATYPLEAYAVTEDGVFRYEPAGGQRRTIRSGDVRAGLDAAARGRGLVLAAPLTIVLAVVPARTQGRYGEERGRRYVHFEVGHAAQNVLLQAVALGLGGVPVGAFDDDAVKAVLGLRADEEPLYLLPVGHPA